MIQYAFLSIYRFIYDTDEGCPETFLFVENNALLFFRSTVIQWLNPSKIETQG